MTISENITDLEIKENKELFPIGSRINKEGHLTISSFDAVKLVEKHGSPLYLIDENTFITKANEYLTCLKKHYNDFLVLYAGKAFACTAIFKIANDLGLGLDVVSGGELFIALKTGFNKKNIYFHGNNKSKDEIEMAIK